MAKMAESTSPKMDDTDKSVNQSINQSSNSLLDRHSQDSSIQQSPINHEEGDHEENEYHDENELESEHHNENDNESTKQSGYRSANDWFPTSVPAHSDDDESPANQPNEPVQSDQSRDENQPTNQSVDQSGYRSTDDWSPTSVPSYGDSDESSINHSPTSPPYAYQPNDSPEPSHETDQNDHIEPENHSVTQSNNQSIDESGYRSTGEWSPTSIPSYSDNDGSPANSSTSPSHQLIDSPNQETNKNEQCSDENQSINQSTNQSNSQSNSQATDKTESNHDPEEHVDRSGPLLDVSDSPIHPSTELSRDKLVNQSKDQLDNQSPDRSIDDNVHDHLSDRLLDQSPGQSNVQSSTHQADLSQMHDDEQTSLQSNQLIDKSINQSIGRSVNQPKEDKLSSLSDGQPDEAIQQNNHQLNNQSTDQLNNQSSTQSISQSNDQSDSPMSDPFPEGLNDLPPFDQLINGSINRSVIEATGVSVASPIDQHNNHLPDQLHSESASQSTSQSTDQSVNQQIPRLINRPIVRPVSRSNRPNRPISRLEDSEPQMISVSQYDRPSNEDHSQSNQSVKQSRSSSPIEHHQTQTINTIIALPHGTKSPEMQRTVDHSTVQSAGHSFNELVNTTGFQPMQVDHLFNQSLTSPVEQSSSRSEVTCPNDGLISLPTYSQLPNPSINQSPSSSSINRPGARSPPTSYPVSTNQSVNQLSTQSHRREIVSPAYREMQQHQFSDPSYRLSNQSNNQTNVQRHNLSNSQSQSASHLSDHCVRFDFDMPHSSTPLINQSTHQSINQENNQSSIQRSANQANSNQQPHHSVSPSHFSNHVQNVALPQHHQPDNRLINHSGDRTGRTQFQSGDQHNQSLRQSINQSIDKPSNSFGEPHYSQLGSGNSSTNQSTEAYPTSHQSNNHPYPLTGRQSLNQNENQLHRQPNNQSINQSENQAVSQIMKEGWLSIQSSDFKDWRKFYCSISHSSNPAIKQSTITFSNQSISQPNSLSNDRHSIKQSLSQSDSVVISLSQAVAHIYRSPNIATHMFNQSNNQSNNNQVANPPEIHLFGFTPSPAYNKYSRLYIMKTCSNVEKVSWVNSLIHAGCRLFNMNLSCLMDRPVNQSIHSDKRINHSENEAIVQGYLTGQLTGYFVLQPTRLMYFSSLSRINQTNNPSISQSDSQGNTRRVNSDGSLTLTPTKEWVISQWTKVSTREDKPLYIYFQSNQQPTSQMAVRLMSIDISECEIWYRAFRAIIAWHQSFNKSIDNSISRPSNPPIDQISQPKLQSTDPSVNLLSRQPVYQPSLHVDASNQSINQSTSSHVDAPNQSPLSPTSMFEMMDPKRQSSNQPRDQPVSRPHNNTSSRSNNQSINQPNNQLINQSINRSHKHEKKSKRRKSVQELSSDESDVQLMNQTDNQSKHKQEKKLKRRKSVQESSSDESDDSRNDSVSQSTFPSTKQQLSAYRLLIFGKLSLGQIIDYISQSTLQSIYQSIETYRAESKRSKSESKNSKNSSKSSKLSSKLSSKFTGKGKTKSELASLIMKRSTKKKYALHIAAHFDDLIDDAKIVEDERARGYDHLYWTKLSAIHHSSEKSNDQSSHQSDVTRPQLDALLNPIELAVIVTAHGLLPSNNKVSDPYGVLTLVYWLFRTDALIRPAQPTTPMSQDLAARFGHAEKQQVMEQDITESVGHQNDQSEQSTPLANLTTNGLRILARAHKLARAEVLDRAELLEKLHPLMLAGVLHNPQSSQASTSSNSLSSESFSQSTILAHQLSASASSDHLVYHALFEKLTSVPASDVTHEMIGASFNISELLLILSMQDLDGTHMNVFSLVDNVFQITRSERLTTPEGYRPSQDAVRTSMMSKSNVVGLSLSMAGEPLEPVGHLLVSESNPSNLASESKRPASTASSVKPNAAQVSPSASLSKPMDVDSVLPNPVVLDKPSDASVNKDSTGAQLSTDTTSLSNPPSASKRPVRRGKSVDPSRTVEHLSRQAVDVVSLGEPSSRTQRLAKRRSSVANLNAPMSILSSLTGPSQPNFSGIDMLMCDSDEEIVVESNPLADLDRRWQPNSGGSPPDRGSNGLPVDLTKAQIQLCEKMMATANGMSDITDDDLPEAINKAFIRDDLTVFARYLSIPSRERNVNKTQLTQVVAYYLRHPVSSPSESPIAWNEDQTDAVSDAETKVVKRSQRQLEKQQASKNEADKMEASKGNDIDTIGGHRSLTPNPASDAVAVVENSVETFHQRRYGDLYARLMKFDWTILNTEILTVEFTRNDLSLLVNSTQSRVNKISLATQLLDLIDSDTLPRPSWCIKQSGAHDSDKPTWVVEISVLNSDRSDVSKPESAAYESDASPISSSSHRSRTSKRSRPSSSPRSDTEQSNDHPVRSVPRYLEAHKQLIEYVENGKAIGEMNVRNLRALLVAVNRPYSTLTKLEMAQNVSDLLKTNQIISPSSFVNGRNKRKISKLGSDDELTEPDSEADDANSRQSVRRSLSTPNPPKRPRRIITTSPSPPPLQPDDQSINQAATSRSSAGSPLGDKYERYLIVYNKLKGTDPSEIHAKFSLDEIRLIATVHNHRHTNILKSELVPWLEQLVREDRVCHPRVLKATRTNI